VIGRNELGSLGSFSLYLPPRSRKIINRFDDEMLFSSTYLSQVPEDKTKNKFSKKVSIKKQNQSPIDSDNEKSKSKSNSDKDTEENQDSDSDSEKI